MSISSIIRSSVITLAILGASLFMLAFITSYLSPIVIEQVAREVVRIEVGRRVGEKVDVLSNSKIVVLAQKKLHRTEQEIESARLALKEEAISKTGEVVAEMLNPDSECRKRLAEYARKVDDEQIPTLARLRNRLVVLIESTYQSVTYSLLREVRIVSASNATAFLLLGLAAILRKKAAFQLLVPAVILVGAVSLTFGVYLLGQDWLHTIIFGEYIGLGYSLYLLGVALLLSDILLFQAALTTSIVNGVLEFLGSAISVARC
jgi:hypothetical protein